MATFLLKTEPTTWSYDDLVREKGTVWDGVTNNAALIHIRAARKGDEAFIYHTGDEKQIVGLARIASNPYEDPANPGRNARGEPKLAVFDLKPLRKARTPVTLARLRADNRFADFALIRQSRLSVMPVPEKLDRILRQMAGL
jgi:predicted RNA-binding protein with PUA-like domain